MKQSNVIRIGLSSLFSLKKTWVYGSIYCLFILSGLMLIARQYIFTGIRVGIFDLIANSKAAPEGSTNHLMFIFVAIPVMVTMMTQVMQRNEQGSIVTKIGSRFRTFHSEVVSAVILAFCLTLLILAISFLVCGLFVGYENTWLTNKGAIFHSVGDKEHFQAIVANLATYKIVWTLLITKFIGCMMIAFFTIFLYQFIKSGAFIMIVLIALAGLDQTGLLPFPIFTWNATLSLENWLDPMVTVYRAIYLIIASIVLYGVTGLLYERKDFLS